LDDDLCGEVNKIDIDIHNIDIILKQDINKVKDMPTRPRARWIDRLEEEDLMFIKRFVLASGSLKALAQAYGVSYPTVRLRLDRLIERIRIFDSDTDQDDFERVVRAQFAEGRIDQRTLRVLLEAHRRAMEERND